jgi:adenylate cyclase
MAAATELMKPTAKRPITVLAICAACTLVFLFLWWRGFVPLQELELFAQDWQTRLGRKTPADERLVLIGIDKPVYSPTDFSAEELKAEPALALLQKNFPWSRAVWARLIEKLGDAGARVIVLDLVFAAPGDGDDELKQALDKYKDRVVIGYNISATKTAQREFFSLQLPDSSVINYAPQTSPAEDDRLGYVNIWPDRDEVLRQARYHLTGGQIDDVLPPETVVESLAVRALRKFGRPDLIPAGFEPKTFRYTAPPGLGYKPNPIGGVLAPKIWKHNYQDGGFFRDKIVLVGPTAEIFQDTHRTPLIAPKTSREREIVLDEMPGPEVHLNIIAAALHSEFLNEPAMLVDLMVICAAGVLAFALCFLVHQPMKRLLAIFLFSVAYWILGQTFFNQHGPGARVILMGTPLLVMILSSSIALTYDYLLERHEKRRVRRTLERYVSRDVVKELLDNPQTFFNTLGGVRKPVTVLFSDVRGFTTLTESADSHALVKQLNEYFQEMVAHVFAHQGSLDKFIGDAVMAVWGSIVSHGPRQDALNAVATALAMKRSLKKLNADWKARGMLELAFGIGINHGEVIVGNLGSSEKMELTVIGDPVNVASRLEGLTKKYHVDLLLGDGVARLVGGHYLLRTIASVQPKGKTRPAEVFTIFGDGAAQAESMPGWLARYEEGLLLYRQREFVRATVAFQECLRQQPGDFLSDMYLKRCQTFSESPPDDSWNGADVMTEK